LGTIELSHDNELVLEPNMVMVVHPNQMIPEIGYFACGDTIITTEDGSFERLSKVPAKHLVEVTPRA
jgi:Xaa-Pro aminopeptidase